MKLTRREMLNILLECPENELDSPFIVSDFTPDDNVRLCFKLNMPGRNSWDGKWSGDNKLYAKVIIFKKNQKDKAIQILKDGPYSYRWSDGWRAEVSIMTVSKSEAREIIKKSSGFHGYDWMINSIINYGKIQTEDI